MNLIISIFFLLLVVYYGFKDIKLGLLFYVVGTFLSPVLRVSSFELSFDIWCFLVIFIIYLIKRQNIVLKRHSFALVPYLIIYLLLTSISSIVFNCDISIATIYAVVRFIIVINMIIELWDDQLVVFADRVLSIVIFVNAGLAVVQMMNLVPVRTFYDLYYKESMTPLLSQLRMGKFNRAFGATGSPVILGGIAAMSYAFFLSTYVDEKKKVKFNIFKILACIICGLLALSKTAILAIPIITVYIIIMCTFLKKSKMSNQLLKILLLAILGGVALVLIVSWMKDKGFTIAYYLDFLTKPFEALATRYDSDSGILAESINIIKDHFIFGVGHATFEGAFIGDSLYIVLMYQTGIIGLVAYLFPYIVSFFDSIKKEDLTKGALIIVFLLIGIGNSLHLSYWVVPFVAIVFSIDTANKEKTRLW